MMRIRRHIARLTIVSVCAVVAGSGNIRAAAQPAFEFQWPTEVGSGRALDLRKLARLARAMTTRQQIDFFFPGNHVGQLYTAVRSEQVDHIGLSVPKIDEALQTDADPPLWKVLGREVVGTFDIVMLEGTPNIELIAPTRDRPVGSGPVRVGPSHVAVEVKDIDAVLQQLDARGVRIRDKVGRPGAMGHQIGFFYVDAFGDGVSYELVDHAPPKRR